MTNLEASLSLMTFYCVCRPADCSTVINGVGVKLQKIDIPMFDGNIQNWRSFLEQYNLTIHSRAELSDTDKLADLSQSFKDGPTKHVI